MSALPRFISGEAEQGANGTLLLARMQGRRELDEAEEYAAAMSAMRFDFHS
jgi:hypothetical protein